jgi:hypothetical protein
MPPIELAKRLALLLALAFFLGLAFEEVYKRDEPTIPGGIRTFPLVGLAGAMLYLVEPHWALAFVAGLLAIAAWLYAFLRFQRPPEGGSGRTMVIPVCNLLIYVLGPIALTQPPWVAIGVTVATVLVIGTRERMHSFARLIPQDEVLTAGKFLILVGIILPLIPDTRLIAAAPVTQTERQTNSTIKHEESQPEQCGTLEAPLFIQIQQPQNQHPKATETKQESEWYTRPDWWMVGATIVLVFVTGLLWMFTAFMWWISRKQFAAANRPRLDIRFVRRIADDAGRIAVEFRVENIGAGSGRVTGSNIVLDFFFDGNLPQPDDLQGEDLLGNVTLGKGGGWRFTAHRNELVSLIQIHEEGLKHLHLVGWIVYGDALGPQTTYFCRRYASINNRFTRVTETDYERSDN